MTTPLFVLTRHAINRRAGTLSSPHPCTNLPGCKALLVIADYHLRDGVTTFPGLPARKAFDAEQVAASEAVAGDLT
jgi:hypothetical protein